MINRKMIPVTEDQAHSDSEPKEYGKLAFVIGAILALTVITFFTLRNSWGFAELTGLETFLSQFMGIFFIVFAGFKFVNLKSFVHGFMMYDVIAKKSKIYAVIYPFLQLGLGIGMFVIPGQALIHLGAVIVSGVALWGVVLSLRAKQKITCACLGNVIKMPLATVSGIEDGSMFVISLYMYCAMLLNFGL